MSDLPIPTSNTRAAAEHLPPLQFADGLPLLLVTLLERRYLMDFQPGQWNIEPKEGDVALPLLREVIGLGKPHKEGQWAQAMPHVLNACHEPGQALILLLHGQQNRHHLYLGGRRLLGAGGYSTEEYLLAQENAFKAQFAGLRLNDDGLKRLDAHDLPELSALIQSAPVLSVVTGIPSGRSSQLPFDQQSLDHLVRAVGNKQFALMVVAEPLEPLLLDHALDACRHLKSEIHSYTHQNMTRSTGKSESISRTETEGIDNTDRQVLGYLLALTSFLRATVPGPQFALMALGADLLRAHSSSQSRQVQMSKNVQESSSVELLNANAEACEQLLQHHIERLMVGRSTGWWRTAVYIVAENESVRQSVASALRSIASGDTTSLDPLRTLEIPPYLLRSAIAKGQILTLHPLKGNQGHPLGESFDTLGTCLSSQELAVVVNLPQQELPGLPMRHQSDFALSVPAPIPSSIMLGALQDPLGRDLGPVTFTPAELNRHCFVTGMTGYGKTNTCMQLLLEAYRKRGIPFLVIEPAKTEYRRLAQLPELKNTLRVYSLGGDSPLPFRLNPLSWVLGIPLGRHIDLLKAVFNASFPMFAGMSYVLEEAILEAYLGYGWSLYTSHNPFLNSTSASLAERSALTPCLQELHDLIEVILARKKYGQEVHQNMGAALRARLRSLMVGNKGLALNTRRSVLFEDLFARPTVIELQNLGDDEEKAFVMALLFTLLYEYAEFRQSTLLPKDQGKLQHLTLVEEAHRLLQAAHGSANPEVGDPRAKAVSMFTDMLAEMRAYGEGFIIADQIPTKLAPETLKNSNLKIIHRLSAPDDRRIAGDCINLDEQQMRVLNTLAPGYAVVHNERIGEAVLTHVYSVQEMQSSEPSFMNMQENRPVMKREDKIYLYQHAGCRSCPSPCDFYHQREDIAQQQEATQQLQSFFDSLLFSNADAAWTQWSRWRTGWQFRAEQFPEKQQDEMKGILFCTATQAAYTWLGTLIMNRNLLLRKEQKLSPRDRLLREQVAGVLSELLFAWTKRANLDEAGYKIYNGVQRRLLELVAATPPRPLEGCNNCPARCRMLPYIAPAVGKVEKTVGQKITDNHSLPTRLEVIRRLAEQHIQFPEAQKDDVQQYLLYCLLTNITVPPSAEGARNELLDVLRGG